jgi:hypothetical protein
MLKWLQNWFANECDGDWERNQIIFLRSTSNPGWLLEVDLSDIPLDTLAFDAIDVQRSATDWVICTLTDGKFTGAGGTQNLIEIVELFHAW